MSELGELRVIAGPFSHGPFDGRDIGHLRADMKMNEPETMGEIGRFQHLAGRDQPGSVEAELRVLASARRPFARPSTVKANADPDVRLDPDFLRGANRMLQFFQLLDHNDDRLAELAAEQRDSNVSGILVAIANDEAFRVLMHGKRGHKFWFAARLETKMKLLAGIDNLFDYFAQRLDFDRKYAAILTRVTELGDSRSECAID